MAITQVRVKLGEEWTQLTLNEATGRWEGTITPSGTSAHQPGGYFALTAEVTNATGQSDTLTGAQYPGLRLVVRETAAPTLTLVSPPQGWLTTNAPVFTFRASDEAGGSGIDPGSAKATVDGADTACTVTESGGVYSIVFSARGLSEGPHVVTASISDYDNNETTVSAAYTVDTVPPTLIITGPELHRVVDWNEVEISGYVRDATSGVASVTVAGEAVETDGGGYFSHTVPLEVGGNQIPVTVTDRAGLSTTQAVWMLRMITDRTQGDADIVSALWDKRWEDFSDAEKGFWAGVVRGAYNAEDANRVGMAVEYISDLLRQAGYITDTHPVTDRTENDWMTASQTGTYLDNVVKIRALVPVHAPPVPGDMAGFTFREANDLEANLVEVDRLFPLMERSPFYSGEVFCGE